MLFDLNRHRVLFIADVLFDRNRLCVLFVADMLFDRSQLCDLFMADMLFDLNWPRVFVPGSHHLPHCCLPTGATDHVPADGDRHAVQGY